MRVSAIVPNLEDVSPDLGKASRIRTVAAMTGSATPQGEWLSIADAAAVLRISDKTVRRRIADGVLEARRIGPRLIRVRVDDLAVIGEPITIPRGRG